MVLVAIFACVFAEAQDQEAAEQYFRTYGTYPSWYSGHYGYAGVRSAYGYNGYNGVYRSGKISLYNFNYKEFHTTGFCVLQPILMPTTLASTTTATLIKRTQ